MLAHMGQLWASVASDLGADKRPRVGVVSSACETSTGMRAGLDSAPGSALLAASAFPEESDAEAVLGECPRRLTLSFR